MFGFPLPVLSRLQIEIIGALIVAAAALIWLGVHDAGVKDEARSEALAPVIAATQAASAAAAVRAASQAAAQEGNLHEAHEQLQAQAAQISDLRGAVADAYRLRDAAIRRAAAAKAAASAGGSQAGGDDSAELVQLRGLYPIALDARAEAESDAADLAAYVAGLRTSGKLCARDYDAVADR